VDLAAGVAGDAAGRRRHDGDAVVVGDESGRGGIGVRELGVVERGDGVDVVARGRSEPVVGGVVGPRRRGGRVGDQRVVRLGRGPAEVGGEVGQQRVGDVAGELELGDRRRRLGEDGVEEGGGVGGPGVGVAGDPRPDDPCPSQLLVPLDDDDPLDVVAHDPGRLGPRWRQPVELGPDAGGLGADVGDAPLRVGLLGGDEGDDGIDLVGPHRSRVHGPTPPYRFRQ
jgi:hypothetical protein